MKSWLLLIILPLLLCGCSDVDAPASDTEAEPPSTTENTRFSLERAVFLGDSNIAHLSSYGIVDESNIWNGSERYLTLEPDVCRRLIVYPESGDELTPAEAARRKRPDWLIITLGTDGALSLDREGLRLSYIALIESILKASPDTRIALQSIFPIRPAEINARFKDIATANECFKRSNSYISEIADEYDLVYIDTHSILLDSDGMLCARYNTDHRDGYHLNKEGLSVMLDNICRTLEE